MNLESVGNCEDLSNNQERIDVPAEDQEMVTERITDIESTVGLEYFDSLTNLNSSIESFFPNDLDDFISDPNVSFSDKISRIESQDMNFNIEIILQNFLSAFFSLDTYIEKLVDLELELEENYPSVFDMEFIHSQTLLAVNLFDDVFINYSEYEEFGVISNYLKLAELVDNSESLNQIFSGISKITKFDFYNQKFIKLRKNRQKRLLNDYINESSNNMFQNFSSEMSVFLSRYDIVNKEEFLNTDLGFNLFSLIRDSFVDGNPVTNFVFNYNSDEPQSSYLIISKPNGVERFYFGEYVIPFDLVDIQDSDTVLFSFNELDLEQADSESSDIEDTDWNAEDDDSEGKVGGNSWNDDSYYEEEEVEEIDKEEAEFRENRHEAYTQLINRGHELTILNKEIALNSGEIHIQELKSQREIVIDNLINDLYEFARYEIGEELCSFEEFKNKGFIEDYKINLEVFNSYFRPEDN